MEMKKIFKLLCLILLTIEASCQTLPVQTPNFETPNGAYLKDLDNVFPFFTGTWKGIIDNKEYTFQFTTFINHLRTFSTERYYYIDELMGKFKVVDLTTNQILYDDLMVSNFENYKIKFATYGNNIGYVFSFRDDEAHCYNFVEFVLLKNSSNLNQITYTGFEYSEYLRTDDCIYPSQLDIPMFLPKVTLTLTRQ